MALAEKFLADYDSHLQTPLMATISRFIRENLTLSSGPAGRETDIAGQQKKVLRPLHPPAGHRDTPRFSRAVGEAHVKNRLSVLVHELDEAVVFLPAPPYSGARGEKHFG